MVARQCQQCQLCVLRENSTSTAVLDLTLTRNGFETHSGITILLSL